MSPLCINRDFFLFYKFGCLNLFGHNVPSSCSVNQNLTTIQLFGLLIELVLKLVDVLSQEKETFPFVHWCDATHTTTHSASCRLSAWLTWASICSWTLITWSNIRFDLLLTIWNGYWAELGISFIMWTIIKRVKLDACFIKVFPECWYTSISSFLCRLFYIIVTIDEYDTTRLLSNLTLLNFLYWGTFSRKILFQRLLRINLLILACYYIYWRCLTSIFNAYALRHDVHSLLIWGHWSPNFICIHLLHVLFASCYEDWVKLVAILDKSLLITTTLLLPIISSSWWLT